MSDTIDRQAAIDAIVKLPNAGIHWFVSAEGAIKALEALPPAEPEIIACGDCKHYICHDRRCGYWNHGVKVLDWCSHAERRANDERRSNQLDN